MHEEGEVLQVLCSARVDEAAARPVGAVPVEELVAHLQQHWQASHYG
jgi:hypothetical protein